MTKLPNCKKILITLIYTLPAHESHSLCTSGNVGDICDKWLFQRGASELPAPGVGPTLSSILLDRIHYVASISPKKTHTNVEDTSYIILFLFQDSTDVLLSTVVT